MANQDQSLTKAWQTQPRSLGSSYTASGSDSGRTFTNGNATGAITLALPKAIAGYQFGFIVTAAQNFVIQPRPGDSLRGTGAGVSKTLTGLGTSLYLECVVGNDGPSAGIWELVYGSAAIGGGAPLKGPLSIYQSDGVTLGTTFGANGNVTIAAPSSGQTLLVNQSLTGSTSATGALVVAGTAGAAAAQMLLCVQQNGFSNGLQISTDGTNMKYSFVNGNMTIGAPTSGGFTVTAQAFNAAGSAAFLANNNLPAGAAFYNENYTANNAALVMNSTGADFGTIGTVAAQVWGLGSTPSIGPVGTAALTWNNTGNVTIAAPSSGNTLTVSAAATQALVILGAGAGIGAISIAGCATVGTKTASMTATNKPGSNNQTTPSTWLPIVLDATNYYIPAYAA